MNYNNNKTGNKRYNQGRNYEESDINELCEKIISNGALSKTLTVEEINLPGKYAYKISDEIKGKMKTNQLRKCFEMIKEAEDIDDVAAARKKLYGVLPLIAYSAGRELCPQQFFDLMSTCITKEALGSKDDIEAFIQFMEAIVAYTKYLEGAKK